MTENKSIFIPILCCIIFACANCTDVPVVPDSKVKTGAEVLIDEHLEKLRDKNIGLFMNPTARIGETHVLDTLLALGVKVTALFAPEHGFRGQAGAGESIKSGIDSASGIPVYSLYDGGKILRPSPEQLQQTNLVLFDMQDVGARFYTYNVSMKRLLEAAADTGTEVWILDRPNPAGGDYVAGWVLDERYRSAVGDYPIPVAHGLTLGELALMAVGEKWLNTENQPDLKIIKMEGWKRAYQWIDTGLEWSAPSPNLPHFSNAFAYLGTCFFEGTTISEGRGTEKPFLIFGAPNTVINIDELHLIGEKYGVTMEPVHFTPIPIPGKALHPKYENVESNGVEIIGLETKTKKLTDPVRFGLELVYWLMESTPEAEYLDFIMKLAGTDRVVQNTIPDSWGEDFDDFVQKRKKYLLYD